jgi:hypothetical protein
VPHEQRARLSQSCALGQRFGRHRCVDLPWLCGLVKRQFTKPCTRCGCFAGLRYSNGCATAVRASKPPTETDTLSTEYTIDQAVAQIRQWSYRHGGWRIGLEDGAGKALGQTNPELFKNDPEKVTKDMTLFSVIGFFFWEGNCDAQSSEARHQVRLHIPNQVHHRTNALPSLGRQCWRAYGQREIRLPASVVKTTFPIGTFVSLRSPRWSSRQTASQ